MCAAGGGAARHSCYSLPLAKHCFSDVRAASPGTLHFHAADPGSASAPSRALEPLNPAIQRAGPRDPVALKPAKTAQCTPGQVPYWRPFEGLTLGRLLGTYDPPRPHLGSIPSKPGKGRQRPKARPPLRRPVTGAAVLGAHAMRG